MAGVVEVGAPRTLLSSVQDICGMSGISRPATIVSPDRNTVQAILACQQALNTIWYKTRWDWRFVWWRLEMVADQMWYDVPLDFDAAGSVFGVHRSSSPIGFLPWEEMIENFPAIRNLPPAFATVDTDLEAVDSACSGMTEHWTIKGGYVGLWQPPSAGFIEQSSPSLVGGYYRKLLMPYGEGDEIEIPMDLYPAHDNLALGIFKQYKEHPDWKVTKQAGEQMLAEAVARQRRVYWESAQLMPWNGV